MNLEKLRNIRHIVLDMDGTIYNDSQLFEYTPRFVNTLDNLGINYTYLTNNSSMSVAEYHAKFKKLNLPAKSDQIYTSTLGTIDYMKSNLPEIQKIFVLGTPGLKSEFENAGYEVIDDFGNDEPQAVIVGFDTSLTFTRMSRAGYWIKSGKMFIATHPDLICPTNQPTLLIDCGSVCAALEKASGKAPDIVFGKPDPSMIYSLMKRHNLSKSDIAVVGDRIYTDIEMAHRAGITSILVLSGEATKDDVEKIVKKPSLVVENIFELGKLLEEYSENSKSQITNNK